MYVCTWFYYMYVAVVTDIDIDFISKTIMTQKIYIVHLCTEINVHVYSSCTLPCLLCRILVVLKVVRSLVTCIIA